MERSLFDGIEKMPVLVVGDLMLDRFVHGDVDRISPESPVPVLLVREQSSMLGGAGNVLSNLAALGASPSSIAVIGDDRGGREIRDLYARAGLDAGGLIVDDTRPTTEKTRFVARGQQMLRVDHERVGTISPLLEKQILAAVAGRIATARALVLSDYGKGVLTPGVLSETIALAKRHGVPVLVDPKGRDYRIYRGADIVTPNRRELSDATGRPSVSSDEEVVAAARQLIAEAGIGAVVATRSEDGLSVVSADRITHHRADAREVFDVSGAGDTVIAVLAALVGAGATLDEAARIANIAGGIAVAKAGTAPVHRDELAAALSPGMVGTGHPDLEHARIEIERWRAAGLTIGFTNGCFDILHAGHVTYLAAARGRCDRLVVGLNRDSSVRLLKGEARPVNDEKARATVLAALASVDLVVPFGAAAPCEDNTPRALIAELRPDRFFKGGDYTAGTLPETAVVESYGGQVEIIDFVDGFSTTGIIAKAKARP